MLLLLPFAPSRSRHRARPPARRPTRLLPGPVPVRLHPALPLSLAILLGGPLLSVLLLAVPLLAQAPPPQESWRTFRTPHFEVVFPEGLEGLAGRAAERAERGLARLDGFGVLPDEPIQLLLTDHVDLSNGFARIAPYPRVTIWARPPAEGMSAMPYDDWLELVITHELVHILHLEMTSPLGRWARRLTGRLPSAWPHFPAFLLPTWGVEGVAVQAESDFTGAGRLHGARFDATIRAALLEGRGERLDQVTGNAPHFPGGERPYAWGGPFFHDLAHEHGPDAVAKFVERQATRLNPLALESAARDAFGASLSTLHEGWLAHREAEARARLAAIELRDLAPTPERLTVGERGAFFPHFVREGGGWVLAWTRVDGIRDPQVVVGTASPRVLASLHLASPLASGPGDHLFTVQPEYRDRYRIGGELWRLDGEGGRVRLRLRGPEGSGFPGAGTDLLRVAGADLHPGHGWIVAVLEGEGTKTLALLDPEGQWVRTLAPPDPGVHWSHPRWSPDGREVALLRWRAGGWWAVGVLEVPEVQAPGGASPSSSRSPVSPPVAHPPEYPPSPGRLPPLEGVPSFRVVEELAVPVSGVAWFPEGDGLLWTSERDGVSNLYHLRRSEGWGGRVRQLTDLPTAAAFPTIAPEGNEVVFSLLTGTGWDLARIPWSPEAGFEPVRPPPRLPPGPDMEEGFEARWEPVETRSWSPRATLRPRHLLPVLDGAASLQGLELLPTRVGVESWAADVVDRHRWDLRLTLPVGGPGRGWEGTASWRWAGLGNPVLVGGVEQRWRVAGVVATPDPEDPDPLGVVGRERAVALSAGVLRPRWRSSVQGVWEVRGIREDLFLVESGGGLSSRAALLRPRRELAQGAFTLSASTARSAPYHPGPARGASLALRLRERLDVGVPDSLRGVPGVDGSRRDLVAQGRAYRAVGTRGLARAGGTPPVFALRGSVGAASGPGAGAGTFLLGGGGGGGAGALGFTWDRAPGAFAVRGFEEGTGGGARAWGGGAELRIPLAVVHRGLVAPGGGLLPAHLDRVAGTLWLEGAGTLPGGREAGGSQGGVTRLAASGAEVALLHTLFFGSPSLLRAGIAVPLAGAPPGRVLPGPSLYAAVGWGF